MKLIVAVANGLANLVRAVSAPATTTYRDQLQGIAFTLRNLCIRISDDAFNVIFFRVTYSFFLE